MAKKKVAVLMGGWSAERQVSLDSGHPIVKTLTDSGNYDVISIDVTRDIEAFIRALTPRPDVVFNALHGTGGEDGIIQGVLNMMQLPYTHSSLKASAIGMDKIVSRRIFDSVGLTSPAWQLLSLHDIKTKRPFDGAYVVKPTNEGSSVGVYAIQEGEDLPNNIPFSDDQLLLVEEFIPGQEIQVGVMGDRALGAIEICPKQGFYDYEAKYTAGKADHFMPARISSKAYDEALRIGRLAHEALGCRGVSRTDLIYNKDAEKFYILELNTHPGMTPLSLLPEIAAYEGISFLELLTWMIENAQCDQ